MEIPSSLKNDSPEEFEILLKERESIPEFVNRKVLIRCQITPEHLKFEVDDEGQGFNPKTLHYSDPLSMIPTGRGILIITAFMDQVYWNETGNRITMIKKLRS